MKPGQQPANHDVQICPDFGSALNWETIKGERERETELETEHANNQQTNRNRVGKRESETRTIRLRNRVIRFGPKTL